MKIKKIYLYIIVSFLMIFTLTGCLTKKTITSEKFKKIMKDKDYKIEEVSKTNVSASQDNLSISFYEYDNKKEAKETFKINKRIIPLLGLGSSKQTNRKMINYETYSFKNGAHYVYLSRVDNTVLLIMGSDDDQYEVEKLVKELGY